MRIDRVIDSGEKQRVSRLILEALTDWFSVTESREEYIRGSADKIFFCAYNDDNAPVGFIYLKQTGEDTVELAVMGVLQEYHRSGVGRELFNAARAAAVEKGYSFMQVKTVKMGMYDDYDRTNMFYKAVGFKEFEVFPMLWDEANPCQIYIMALK